MYIRQLLAVTALLLIGANSMPQPQGDFTPSSTEAGVFGPPTGTSSGSPMGGDHRPGSWKDFMEGHHSHEGPPPGVGPSGTEEGTGPTSTAEAPTPTDTSTDSYGGGAAASSSAPAAASSSSVASDKLRRAVLF